MCFLTWNWLQTHMWHNLHSFLRHDWQYVWFMFYPSNARPPIIQISTKSGGHCLWSRQPLWTIQRLHKFDTTCVGLTVILYNQWHDTSPVLAVSRDLLYNQHKRLSGERFHFVIDYIPCHNHQYSRGVIHQILALLLHLLFVITNSMAYWLARLGQITWQYECHKPVPGWL